MAVLFVEGFTGVPRGVSNFMATNNPLLSLGWKMQSMYNGGNVVQPNDSSHTTVVEADPFFATRNVMRMTGILGSTSITSYFEQVLQTIDTRGYQKFVLGFMFTPGLVNATADQWAFYIMNNVAWQSSSAATPGSTRFAEIVVSGNGNGTVGGVSTPLIRNNKATHVELLIEQDTDRIRTYIDGTLLNDVLYTGTFADALGGFSLLHGPMAPQVQTVNMTVSNLYLLGLDDVHTGILGPNVRVMEFAPQADFSVTWNRPAGVASNAAVMQQYFNATNPNLLTTGELNPDLYRGPDAVAANAAVVYGAAIKVNAQTMAEGTHSITSAARYGTADAVGPRSVTLTLGTSKAITLDISKNPSTGARWSPAEITSAGIGIKMVN